MSDTAELMSPANCRVQKTVQETADTFTLELEPPGGRQGFSFAAGQFNMLYDFGAG